MAWWSAERRSRNFHRQPLLLCQRGRARCHQARHVLVRDRVVLPGLHAGLAFAELRAPDADELEDAPSQKTLLSPCAARRVGHEDLRGPVGEDLEGIGVAYVPFATPSSMICRGPSASLSNGIGSILGTRTHFQPASPVSLDLVRKL